MQWGAPGFLFLLWLLPVVGYLLYRSHRRRLMAAHRFMSEAMADRLVPRIDTARAWLKGTAIVLGLGCLIVAAARPRFGEKYEYVARKGVDLFVLLDVSKSMLAQDVRPTRLERAKLDIKDLLDVIPGDRVGLIVFAGKPIVSVPLTTDHNFIRQELDQVDPDSAPRGGSLIGDAIRQALASMPPRGDRDQAIVLITDGEDHESFPLAAAEIAAERDVTIFTVGLGDPVEGARIPLASDRGARGFLTHGGQQVWSKMDEPLLEEIASATGGEYIPAKTQAYDLGRVYEQHLEGLTRGDIDSSYEKRYREQFPLFLALGVMFLLFDVLLASYPTGR
ncbi:von Willebrand factor type A domain protein [Planctomycetes bacterium Pan216]|uniref:von Willebrand factor type A domain protein n=1 Tax=Kolteria novifilia TaxID=2527975 RepID=A0A518B165_9BACT|nr:von Willebrand factor type A domain protein [Planctomycetes bacterium Pan216]